MEDGSRLPLRSWLPEAKPGAVILALHGFTDHSSAFAWPGAEWAKGGVAVYAYDQRGFGAAPRPGIWAGSAQLAADMRRVVGIVRARHPGVPLFLLGESMGAAVVVAALDQPAFPTVDGIILVAPAVWGWRTLNPVAAISLRVAAHIAPALGFEAASPVGMASDNTAARVKMWEDPLVLHTVRLDTLYGLVSLMDEAIANAPLLHGRAIVLYGARDGLIPAHARDMFLARLAPEVEVRRYPDGYHMLLRDLHADVVRDDILAWVTAPVAVATGG